MKMRKFAGGEVPRRERNRGQDNYGKREGGDEAYEKKGLHPAEDRRECSGPPLLSGSEC